MYIKLCFLALIIFLALLFYFLWNKSEIIDEMFYSGKIIYFVKFFAAFLPKFSVKPLALAMGISFLYFRILSFIILR